MDALTPRAERAARLAAAVSAAEAPRLDALVADTATSLGTGTAHLSLLIDRQVTASAQGAAASPDARGNELPFDDTICATVLRVQETTSIPDAATDARVASIPAVRSGSVRAYLGSPVRSGGHLVGVLCVFEDQARAWSADDLAALESHASDVAAELDRLAADSERLVENGSGTPGR